MRVANVKVSVKKTGVFSKKSRTSPVAEMTKRDQNKLQDKNE